MKVSPLATHIESYQPVKKRQRKTKHYSRLMAVVAVPLAFTCIFLTAFSVDILVKPHRCGTIINSTGTTLLTVPILMLPFTPTLLPGKYNFDGLMTRYLCIAVYAIWLACMTFLYALPFLKRLAV